MWRKFRVVIYINLFVEVCYLKRENLKSITFFVFSLNGMGLIKAQKHISTLRHANNMVEFSALCLFLDFYVFKW